MSVNITMLAIASTKTDADMNTIKRTVIKNVITNIARKGTKKCVWTETPARIKKDVK